MSKGQIVATQSTDRSCSKLELLTRSAVLTAFGDAIEPEIADGILADIKTRVDDLLLDGDSAIERVLAERIAIAEVQVQYLQNAALATKSLPTRIYLDRELNSASNRLLQALRSLASIRRIPNLTLVQVNNGTMSET